jgi:hypothetical protein
MFYQCNAQKKTLYKNQDMKLIDSSFEKLNINNPILLETKKRYGTNMPPKYIVDLEQTLTDRIVKTGGIVDIYYDQWIFPNKGWFKIYKDFYANGNIKLKKIRNKTSQEDYKSMYEFDSQGNLIKTTNFDKDWKTPFEAITETASEYGKKFHYQVKTGTNDVISDHQNWLEEYVKIWRKEKDGKKYWVIGFNKAHFDNPDDKKCERLVILVDDTTGKVLEKLHYFDWYNRLFKNLDNLLGLTADY